MTAALRHATGGYREYAPPDALAMFAEACWTHLAPRSVVAGAAHRVLPELSLSLGFDVVRDERGRPIEGAPVIIGPKLQPQIFPIVANRELTAVRLKPEWVGPMLGIDALDFDSQVVDLHAVRPAIADALHDALWKTHSAAASIDILAEALLRFRASATGPAPSAASALDAVRRTAGSVLCDRIAARAGVSPRHLRRQVHDAMGVSPKRYARTLRLNRAMRLADRSGHPLWADVAVAAGYCDQSHLIRECLAVTGGSPRQLHGERRRQVIAMAERSNPA